MFRVLVICLMFLSVNAFAELRWVNYDWGDGTVANPNAAETSAYGENEKGEATTFSVTAQVVLSKSNKQKIYFFVKYSEGESWHDTCDIEEFKSRGGVFRQEQVWRVNSQNIRMKAYCTKGEDGVYELSATPSTRKGSSYVADEFLDSTDIVEISNFSFTVEISAEGFKKVWYSYGGDAL